MLAGSLAARITFQSVPSVHALDLFRLHFQPSDFKDFSSKFFKCNILLVCGQIYPMQTIDSMDFMENVQKNNRVYLTIIPESGNDQ
jgi:hypothetical protein